MAAGMNGKLSQAYIVSSQSEEKALGRAEAIAAEAVCSGTGARPCGLCPHCRKAKLGIHPDIIRISYDLDDSGKPKRSIGVDGIKAIVRDAVVLPNEAERKVYIISPAKALTVEAQNSALKLLEEPPEHVVLILCTDSAERLLPTVRSRCTEINCGYAEVKVSEQLVRKAEEYLAAAASRDPIKVFKWCSANEDLNKGDSLDLVCAVKDRISDALCDRKSDMRLSRDELMDLAELCDKCSAYLNANVSPKHVYGLLAVDFMADGEDRGSKID